MGSVSDVIVEGGVLNEVRMPAPELVLVDVEHVGIQTRNNDDRADMRIRTRLKRNRKKQRPNPGGLLRVCFLEAFLLVSE